MCQNFIQISSFFDQKKEESKGFLVSRNGKNGKYLGQFQNIILFSDFVPDSENKDNFGRTRKLKRLKPTAIPSLDSNMEKPVEETFETASITQMKMLE